MTGRRPDPIEDFLQGLAEQDVPEGLADAVMADVRRAGRPASRRPWLIVGVAAAAAALVGAGLWIGSMPPGPTPTSSLAPEPTLFVRTFDGRDCPLAGLPPGPITIQIDPTAAWPDHVTAIDGRGDRHAIFWAEGFHGSTLADPVIRDPAGEVVARDGDQFRTSAGDDRLHGYMVCSGSGNLYVTLLGREPTTPVATPTAEPPPSIDLGVLDGSWVLTAPAPIQGRTGHTAVWTGSEMIVWGGEPGPESDGDARANDGSEGAAYDPIGGTWRLLPRAPIVGRYGHTAVWTGTEMLVFGGLAWPADGRALDDGAAYDPAADRWRPLPAAPFAPSGFLVSTWARDRWLVLDGWNALGDRGTGDGAVYDPASDAWTPLPTLDPSTPFISIVWTRNDALVLTADTLGNFTGQLVHPSDPEPAWRTIPVPTGLRLFGTSLLFTGTEVLAATQEVNGGDVVVAWDVARETWRLADPPLGLGGGDNTWTGTLAVFGFGTRGIDRRTIYDPTRDVWFGFAPTDGLNREFATQVWAGDRLLVWGGYYGESQLRPTEGLVFMEKARYVNAVHEVVDAGNEVRVEVLDASGTLVVARTPTQVEFDAIDQAAMGEDGLLVAQLDERSVFVEWVGGPGDQAARLEIGEDGRTIELVAVPTYGDAIPFVRGLHRDLQPGRRRHRARRPALERAPLRLRSRPRGGCRRGQGGRPPRPRSPAAAPADTRARRSRAGA